MPAKTSSSSLNPLNSHPETDVVPESIKAKKLMSISFKFPPQTNPTANRSSNMLKHLSATWQVNVLTSTADGYLCEGVVVDYAQGWYPSFLLNLMTKLKLEKFRELFIWPDGDIFWLLPAILKGYQVIQQQKPDVITVFMMPYSAGLVGIVLKWLTGLPLVMNVSDPLTCIDMHSSFPTWIHYQMTRWLEDFYVQQCDAITYISQLYMESIRDRQPQSQQSKFYVIRGGISLEDFATPLENFAPQDTFQIIYTGGMVGWYEFYQSPERRSILKKIYRSWMNLGRYVRAEMDYRSASPVYIGKAIQQVISKHSEWQDKIQFKLYGNRFPESVVEKVLQNQNIQEVISVFDPIPNSQAIQIARQADLLFMSLPDQPEGFVGGRMSLKTYEYLMSDRPILAAVPDCETRNYLEGKHGVWIVDPTDIDAMAEVISELAAAKFSGKPIAFDRKDLQDQLSYATKAQEFSEILHKVCSK